MNDRPIDINKLDEEQLTTAISKISDKITQEVDATCERANALLKRYGLSCKMQIVIEEASTSETTSEHDKIGTK